ncbi:MAG: hypothetical protein WCO68_04235 [Verrucomicrobiota bacterium]
MSFMVVGFLVGSGSAVWGLKKQPPLAVGRRGLFLKCVEEPSPSARKRDAYDDHHHDKHGADDAYKAHDWETGEVHLLGGVTLDAGECQSRAEEIRKNAIRNSGNQEKTEQICLLLIS